MDICSIERTRQLLVVEAAGYDSASATLSWWELQGEGGWACVGRTPAAIGRAGLALLKREGDGKTPAGRFRMGTGFGAAPKPGGEWPYRITDAHDYWVDDPQSPDYNRWVRYAGDPAGRWRSYERLDIPLYEKAAVIGCNVNPIVPGRGSAIFLHIWSGPQSPSAGCVTTSREQVVRTLRWMRPDAEPAMAIGTREELQRLVPFWI